jgi:chromate transport protein ChrA
MPEGEGRTHPQSSEKPPQVKESGPRAIVTKLRRRRIIETLAAFIGGGWLLVEVVERLLVGHYKFPEETIDLTVVSVISALLSTLVWRWFRSTEKRPGNVKIEVLLVPLILLATAAIDLDLVLRIAGVPGKTLL